MRRIFVLLAFCLMLSACGQASSTPALSGEEICFTDDLGREVTVENPQRVVCITASFADIWCLAGGADTIVATTSSTWKYFDLPLKEDVVDLGDSKNLNLEQLIACEPPACRLFARIIINMINISGKIRLPKMPSIWLDSDGFFTAISTLAFSSLLIRLGSLGVSTLY